MPTTVGRGRTGTGPRFVAGLGGPFIAVAVLLLLAPVAGAAPTRVVIVAPYAHASKSVSFNALTSGCSTEKERSPTYSLKSGSGTYSASAAVPMRCPNLGNGAGAQASGGFGLQMRLANLTGTRTIYVNWTVRATGSENLSLAHCLQKKPPASLTSVWVSGCSQFAESALVGYATIYDGYSGQGINPTSSWAGVANLTYLTNTSVCYSSGCTKYNSVSPNLSNQSFAVTTSATWVFTAKFLAKHTYWLQTEIGAFVEVSVSTQNAHLSAPVWGSAAVDMGTGGNGATLSSITIV